jgi:hypothetical protein
LPLNGVGGAPFRASEFGSKDRPISLAYPVRLLSKAVPPTRRSSAVAGRNAAVGLSAVDLFRA